MKRVALSIIVLILSIASVFSSQKAMLQTSSELDLLDTLYRAAGISPVQMIYPISADTIIREIQQTNLREHLPIELQEVLDNLLKTLNGDDFYKISEDLSISPNVVVSPELFLISTKPAELSRYDWTPAYINRSPLLEFWLDLNFTEYAFGHFDFDISVLPSVYYSKQVETNLVIANGNTNKTQPHEAYVALGNSNINFQIGRYRNSTGRGWTGNMGIGDSFLFRDYMKLTLAGHPVAYDLFINRFDSEDGSNTRHKFTEINQESPLLIIHRMSSSFFSKLTLSLYEGVQYYTKASAFDPKVLNPFMVFHNTNTFKYNNTNNFFGLELDWAIKPSLSLHFETIFDQIKLSGGDESTEPNAYGLLANITGTILPSKGILTWYAEGAYTNHALYLKENEVDSNGNPIHHYNIDLIVGNKLWDNDKDNDYNYIGYKYGPNTVLGEIGIKYDSLSAIKASFNLMFKARGDTGLQAGDDILHEADRVFSPHIFTEGHKPEYLLQATASASYLLIEAVNIYGSMCFQNFWNHHNIEGKKLPNLSLSLGVRISPLSFFHQ